MYWLNIKDIESQSITIEDLFHLKERIGIYAGSSIVKSGWASASLSLSFRTIVSDIFSSGYLSAFCEPFLFQGIFNLHCLEYTQTWLCPFIAELKAFHNEIVNSLKNSMLFGIK